MQWVYKGDLTYCSNCKVTTERITPYCPWCGKRAINFGICKCYHIENDTPCCWGTKEKEICSCRGYTKRCDFYEEVRRS